MKPSLPKFSLQPTDSDHLSVSIECTSPKGEVMAFTVLIQAALTTEPARTVSQLALAACLSAQDLLDELLQFYRADAAVP